jgi:hypothetical protein
MIKINKASRREEANKQRIIVFFFFSFAKQESANGKWSKQER